MPGYPFLKANIEALAAVDHPVFQWLHGQNVTPATLDERLFMNKWNLHDWKLDDGQGMFEAMPPAGLYRSWTGGDKADTSVTIIVGCNLGYGLNHVLTNTPDSHKVVLLEPRAEMLVACLSQTDYTPFFENKKLHLCPPHEEYLYELIKKMDLQFIYGQIHLRGDIPSRQLGPEYAKWTRIAKEKLENFSMELATLRFRQDVMVSNELNNFRQAMDDGTLKSLQNRGGGVGAVILGAGPSLATYAPQLAANPGHALYTTALQTMPALHSHGLKPHFCLAIDYDPSMLKVYDRLDTDWARDVPLIYSTKMNPEVVRRYPGPTLPLWTLGGMGTFMMQGHDLVLDAGGNVSLTLTRFLRWCGVSHILFVGQDFAWTGTQTHADGHHNSNLTIVYNPTQHQKTTNLAGEEIITTIQYMTSKRELEGDLKKTTFPIYNLYGGGADIEGTKPVDLLQAHTQGILASAPGSVDRFLFELTRCRDQKLHMTPEPRSTTWSTSLRNVDKRLTKLFKKLGPNQQEIHNVLNNVDRFLKHDPLYAPYLFNEAIDLAGLTKAKLRYGPEDLAAFKKLVRKIMKKVREVDRLVCTDAAEQAA